MLAFTLPDLQLTKLQTAIKTVRHWHKDQQTDQTREQSRPEPHKLLLIFDILKTIQRERKHYQ